jgi:hypothetical protein
MPYEYRVMPADDLANTPPTTTTVSRNWLKVYAGDMQTALHRMDEDGWELVTCFDHGNSGTMFIFRRTRYEPASNPETGINAAGTVETGIKATKSR